MWGWITSFLTELIKNLINKYLDIFVYIIKNPKIKFISRIFILGRILFSFERFFSQDSSLKTEYYNNLFSLIKLAILIKIAKDTKSKNKLLRAYGGCLGTGRR